MSNVRQSIDDELKRLAEDILYTEKSHFAASSEQGHVHLVLGLIATVTSAIAAAAIISESEPWIPGVLALLAAVASAVLTFVKPDERAAQHLASGRALGALRVRIRQTRNIDLPAQDDIDPTHWVTRVADLTDEKADIDNAAPPVSNRVFKKAQSKIRHGDFDHDSVTDGSSKPTQ